MSEFKYELEQFPNASEIEWKDSFIDKYEKLTDIEIFKKYSLSFLRRSIRVNTLKFTVEEMKEVLTKKGWNYEEIPWIKNGLYVYNKIRRDIGNFTEHALGYFYVQEAVSMIPPIVLDPKPGEKVLDMCAAPGSKSTQIANMMENKGLLVVNEKERSRVNSLRINMERSGVTNAIITNMDGNWFKDQEYDKIQLDAPCSGTGTIRKSVKTIRMWNTKTGEKIATIQKELFEKCWAMLKPGGTLVYSTCTLEPEENECVIDWALNKYSNLEVLPIDLNIKSSGPVMEYNGVKFHEGVKNVLRLWPQDNDTEGFFICKIKKKE